MMDIYRLLEAGLEVFGLYYGTYRAKVIDNNDPDHVGRLIVHCPQVHGNQDFPKIWSWPISSAGVTKGGIWSIPDIGEWVYVKFDHGRPENPLWIGGWWERGGTTRDMVPTNVVVCTPEGMKLVIDRKALTVLIEQSQGNSMMISDDECSVKHNGTIKVQGNKVEITADDTCDVRAQGVINLAAIDEVNILSTGDVRIDGANKVQISSTTDLKLAATGKLSIECDTQVEVKSTKLVSVESPVVAVVAAETSITGDLRIMGNVHVIGNGNVQGSWLATQNSAHHTHPVQSGVAIQGNP